MRSRSSCFRRKQHEATQAALLRELNVFRTSPRSPVRPVPEEPEPLTENPDLRRHEQGSFAATQSWAPPPMPQPPPSSAVGGFDAGGTSAEPHGPRPPPTEPPPALSLQPAGIPPPGYLRTQQPAQSQATIGTALSDWSSHPAPTAPARGGDRLQGEGSTAAVNVAMGYTNAAVPVPEGNETLQQSPTPTPQQTVSTPTSISAGEGGDFDHGGRGGQQAYGQPAFQGQGYGSVSVEERPIAMPMPATSGETGGVQQAHEQPSEGCDNNPMDGRAVATPVVAPSSGTGDAMMAPSSVPHSPALPQQAVETGATDAMQQPPLLPSGHGQSSSSPGPQLAGWAVQSPSAEVGQTGTTLKSMGDSVGKVSVDGGVEKVPPAVVDGGKPNAWGIEPSTEEEAMMAAVEASKQAELARQQRLRIAEETQDEELLAAMEASKAADLALRQEEMDAKAAMDVSVACTTRLYPGAWWLSLKAMTGFEKRPPPLFPFSNPRKLNLDCGVVRTP